jgi:hypothetical protein
VGEIEIDRRLRCCGCNKSPRKSDLRIIRLFKMWKVLLEGAKHALLGKRLGQHIVHTYVG